MIKRLNSKAKILIIIAISLIANIIIIYRYVNINPIGDIPKGMILVPSGDKQEGFLIDASPTTVIEFREFIKKTKHITDADKFKSSGIFDIKEKEWILKDSANWEYPLGRDKDIAKEDHPVTHVSYYDAVSYCKYKNKRLPTEQEWEHAAKNGRENNNVYSWGNSFRDGDKYKGNIWQGSFPEYNSGEDGYLYTSPVGAFGETKLGLKDMFGNVWEWTSTDYDKDKKILKGGSFMCHNSYCHGYRIKGDTKTTTETSLFHTGFRCVKDI